MSGPYDPPYDPQYPQDPGPYPYQQYAGYPPGPADPGIQDRGRLAERLADRLAARPAPRFGISLAGAGVVLAILGVIFWGFTYIFEAPGGIFGGGSGGSGGTGGGSRHYLGGVLALVVVVIGYVLAIVAQRGPLATAGVGASAIGVPVALEFFTFDLRSSGGEVVNFDAVTWISIVVWLVSYLFVRGARGHSFYLGLAAWVLWDYAIDKAAPTALNRLISVGDATIGGDTGFGGGSLDFGAVAGVSLTIGLLYYVIAWALDRSGRHGAAVALALVGFPAVALGIAALIPDLKQVGTGFVLLAVGLLLAAYGARYGRRFTTWVWALGAAGGAVAIMLKLVADNGGVTIGISLIALGAIFVVVAALVAKLTNEPDDVVAAAQTR
jgi:hypothetical protein